jgi:hypothetical protein
MGGKGILIDESMFQSVGRGSLLHAVWRASKQNNRAKRTVGGDTQVLREMMRRNGDRENGVEERRKGSKEDVGLASPPENRSEIPTKAQNGEGNNN